MLNPKERAAALAELQEQGKLDKLVKSFTLDELVPIVKLLVDPELSSFVTRDTVRPTWEHARRREYPVRSCVNYFESIPRVEKRKADMYSLNVISLGSRDIITAKNNFDPMKANGQRVIAFLPDTSEIKEFAVWGHDVGADVDTKKPLSFWHKHRVMIQERPFVFQSGEKGVGKEIALIEESVPVDKNEVISHLLQHAIPEFDAITAAYLYQPVIIRGKIVSFDSIEDWEPTGRLVEVLDRTGKPMIDELTKEPLKREERVAKRGKEGQPLIQPRLDDINREIYTFAVSIQPIDSDEPSENRIRVRFLNKKLAEHFISISPNQDQVFRDAHSARGDPTEDTWDICDGFLSGTEVLIVGSVTRFQHDPKGRRLNWVDIEGTMMIALDGSSSPSPSQVTEVTVPVSSSVTKSVPQSQTIQPVTTHVPEPSIEDVIVARPVAEPVIQEPLTPIQKIFLAIEEAVETWQTHSIDIPEIEMIQSQYMTEFCVPGTAQIRPEYHDRIRLAIKNWKKQHEGQVPTAPPIVSTDGPAVGRSDESFQGIVFTKEPDTEPELPTMASQDVTVSAKTSTKTSARTSDNTLYECPACHEKMSQDQVFEHWNTCRGKKE